MQAANRMRECHCAAQLRPSSGPQQVLPVVARDGCEEWQTEALCEGARGSTDFSEFSILKVSRFFSYPGDDALIREMEVHVSLFSLFYRRPL